MRSLRLIFLIVVLASPGAARLFAVECRVLGWDEEVEDVRVRTASGEQTLTVATGFISRQWTAAAGEEVVFYRPAPVTPANPAGREILASVTLPPETPRVLLILALNSGATAGTPYRLLALPDIDRASGVNHVRIYNFGSRPAAWSLAGGPVETLAPGANVSHRYQRGTLRGRLKVAVDMSESWQVMVSRTIALPDDQRVLLFVRDAGFDAEASSALPVQVRQIYEPVQPVAPSAPPDGG